jgi:hypothetical protein
MKYYILDEELFQIIGSYLGNCPYLHVKEMITRMENLKELLSPNEIKVEEVK